MQRQIHDEEAKATALGVTELVILISKPELEYLQNIKLHREDHCGFNPRLLGVTLS